MSEPTPVSDRHSYEQMARLYPRQWVAFVAHGAERYEVIDASADLPVLMRRVAASSKGGRASFAHLRPQPAVPARAGAALDL